MRPATDEEISGVKAAPRILGDVQNSKGPLWAFETVQGATWITDGTSAGRSGIRCDGPGFTLPAREFPGIEWGVSKLIGYTSPAAYAASAAEVDRIVREESLARDRKDRGEMRALAAFQSGLKAGDMTNCGMVVEVRPSILQVQMRETLRWVRRDQLRQSSVKSCNVEG
ncbi:hypothetical protein GCM10009107_62490 [Ideonella azotifigens]|uniref:Uncharacterized protein n=2 Tax=Ideonella azotifigens TaxID=513160 RepID=A0ABN1KLR7_9BURK